MKDDITVEVSIDPKTIIEIGSVAKQRLLASDWPAKPPMTNTIGICAPKIAWAITRIITFLRAFASVYVMSKPYP